MVETLPFPVHLCMMTYSNKNYNWYNFFQLNLRLILTLESVIIPYSATSILELSKLSHFMLIYIYIFLILMHWHKLPLGCELGCLTRLVRSSSSTYHQMTNLLWWINSSSFNWCVSISSGCLDE